MTTQLDKPTAAKPKRTRRRLAVIGTAVAAFLAVAGAAVAAVLIFGFGSASVAATPTLNLTVDTFTLDGPLIPGATVGASAVVHNPNTYPVSVTSLIIQTDAGFVGTGAGCVTSTLHAVGAAVTVPVIGASNTLASAVTVAPGGAALISVPSAVHQDSGATAMCGLNANVAVTALAGS